MRRVHGPDGAGRVAATDSVRLMLVRVLDVPVELYFQSATQLAATVTRVWGELHDPGSNLPLGPGDAAALDDLLRIYGPCRDTVAAQAGAARDVGESTFTLELELPSSAPDDIAYLTRLLIRVEQLSAEHGADLPASPEIRAFRVWLLAAIAAQLTEAP